MERIFSTYFKKSGLAILLSGFALVSQAQPIDNPISTFYTNSAFAGEGYPAWTDDIKWNNTINMATYTNGANDFVKFENARDQLYTQGGGVLYYPAGTYDFSDHPTDPNLGRGLHLKKGVVIRGEAPSTNAWAVKNRSNFTDDSGLSDLQTVFVFPTWDKKTNHVGEFEVMAGNGLVPRTWNQVGLMPDAANNEHISDVNYVGVAWVKFQFATVYFGDDFNWKATQTTYGTAGAWKSGLAKTTNQYGQNWAERVPDGTHPFDPFTGAAPNGITRPGSKCRFIFGCRFENAVVHDDIWKHGSATGTQTFGYFGARFAGRVVLMGEHLFVGNSIIPKPTESFYFDMTIKRIPSNTLEIKTVCYDYARSIGFDLNKSLSSQRKNNCMLTGPNTGPYYLDDIIVQDNYTWQHGNKGYEIAGKWAIVRRNVREGKVLNGHVISNTPSTSDDVYGFGMTFNGGKGWFNTLNGDVETKPTDDNMSRGMDMGGWNMWIDKNYINGQGSWPGNDGEGILWQEHGWIESFSTAVTNNEQGPNVTCPFVSTSYTAPWGTHAMGMLQGWNKVFKVGIWGPGAFRFEDFSVIGNTNTALAVSSSGTYKDKMYDADCTGPADFAPVNLSVLKDPASRCNIISWTDVATNESSFRVDRRDSGSTNWTKIAYRPRNATGGNSGPANPDAWAYPGTAPGGLNSFCTGQFLDLNPQQWYDFTAVDGKNYQYRVIAIACDTNDVSASTDAVTATSGLIALDAENGLLLYPVPSRNSLNLRLENKFSGQLSLRIMDMQGRTVQNKTISKNQDVYNEDIETRDLKAGLYTLKVSGNGFNAVSKFIVEK